MIFGKNVNKYYLKYWYLFLLGILSLFVVDYVCSVLPPEIIGKIIDGLDDGSLAKESLVKYVLYLFLIGVIAFITRFSWRMGFFGVGYRVAADLRHELFKKSLTLSQTFYSNNKVGGLMSYYINDVGSIRESFGWGAMMTFDACFLVPMILYKMYKINWIVATICLGPLLLVMVCAVFVGGFMEKRYKLRQDSFESLSDYTQESISGIRVIKAFVREKKEAADFGVRNKDNERINMNYLKLQVLFNTLIDAFIWTIFFAIILLGGYFVARGTALASSLHISVGELTQLVAYFDTLLWPMFAIGDIINIHSQAKASLTRINTILDAKVDLIEGSEHLDNSTYDGSIEFNHLTFKYPDSKDQNALTDVTFKINPGEFVGIIGRTGSSKTTLVNLLLRLYNVDNNEILLEGKDIMSYKVSDVREAIGYVPQDNFLYSTSIESNIAFSSSNPDASRVKREAMIAGVHSDIMGFPSGYNTVLGERGVSVSGGQKQRISIARALYKDPKVLILDDSLSAVDTKTEADILEYLKSERKGKTTILIAHRVSSIKDADKILVLDTGGIVTGYGTHEELIQTNEIYQETYRLQKLDEEGGVNHA